MFPQNKKKTSFQLIFFLTSAAFYTVLFFI